jgi:hypothetical protein
MTPCQGESEHRRVKRQYRRVHKGRFTRGIANQQHRERQLIQMGEAAPKNTSMSGQIRNDNRLDNLRQDQDKSTPSEDDEALPHVQPQDHHYISSSVRHKIRLSTWLDENQDDPALKVSHIVGQIDSSEPFPRSFSLVSRSTCLADYSGATTTATNTHSLWRNKTDFVFYTTGYINTIYFAYTTRHMTCVAPMIH